MQGLKVTIPFILVLSCTCIAQDPVVSLPQGRIVGTKVYTDKSVIPIEIYYGIPYATPPVARYRFMAPELHAGWRRIFYAHRIPPHCPDSTSNKSDSNMSEDCLFLNIWTTRPADGKQLPVLIILFSESWTKSGVPLPCQDLAAEGVVVVTIGYRLNFFSFFNLGSMAARGNLALLDQYLALLWVRDNIAAFGGDPAATTVLGHSAGADSLLHHIVSSRSNGLFQRAIIMSPRDIWKLIDEQRVEDVQGIQNASRELAQSLGCTNQIDQELLHCMRTRPITDIISMYSKRNWSKFMQPVSENYLPESEQYLPMSLLAALSNTKQTMPIDLLFGTTDLDALNYSDESYVDLMKLNASQLSGYINKKVIPQVLKMFSLYRLELLPVLSRAIRWEYWNERPRSTSNVHDVVEYLGRVETSAKWGAAGALLAARLARLVSRLYVYRYSVPSTVDLYGRSVNFSGAGYGSDLISLLGDALMLQITRRPTTNDEKLMSSMFRRYIIHFVKYGYPESENKWQRYKAGDAHIYEISDGSTDLKESSATKEVQFWLHYLPDLTNLFQSLGQTGQLTTLERDGGRLRGGVFAMCGVAVVLLLLLCASAVILQRQRLRRRLSISVEVQNK